MYRKDVLQDESVQPSSFSSHFHSEIHDVPECVHEKFGHGSTAFSKDTDFSSMSLEHKKHSSEVKSYSVMRDMADENQANRVGTSEKQTALYRQSGVLSMSSVAAEIQYEYDVLLIYDPEENDYYVERLLKYLEPQKLSIFDFVKDSPPGIPQRKVLQSILEICRYTCIVITRKFITNYWLQLKTDMTIQDMLDNGDKLYSVIGVVMDLAIKREHLPLDLATLSPLFCYEKYFENRVKLAFDSNTRFHMQSWKNNLLSKKLPNFDVPALSAYEFKPCEKFHPPIEGEFSFTTAQVSPFSNSNTGSEIISASKRSPQEHGDNTYILPPSLLTTYHGMDSSLFTGIQRGVSITISSTGCRSPKETCEVSSVISDFHPSLSINASSTLKEPSNDLSVCSSQCESLSENGDSEHGIENVPLSVAADSHDVEVPSMEFSELEISVESIHEKLNSKVSISDSNLAGNACTSDGSSLTTSSLNLSEGELCAANFKQLTDVRECQSLPISLNNEAPKHPKRSHSLLSTARLKLFRLKSRKKKDPK